MPGRPDIRITGAGDEWSQAAADLLNSITRSLINANGRCLIALAGGSTPQAVYQTLTSPKWRPQFNWEQIYFLFGDERCVPPDRPESNFAMAQAALFHPLGIASGQIYRMKGEAEDPADAARAYETTLKQLTRCSPPAFPRIDLVLLGIGEDGHTASLFPESPALHDSEHAVAVTHSPKGIPRRLTLTLGVINQATVVLFLVTGANKAPIVRAVLESQNAAERALPAAMVAPESGRLIWLLDQAAAGQLSRGGE